MSRPNDEGHRANDALQVQSQNQYPYFANDGDGSKAPAEHEFLPARLSCSAAGPSLRAVGDWLRGIGGRP